MNLYQSIVCKCSSFPLVSHTNRHTPYINCIIKSATCPSQFMYVEEQRAYTDMSPGWSAARRQVEVDLLYLAWVLRQLCFCSRQQVLWANSLLCPEMREREEAGDREADTVEKCQAHSESLSPKQQHVVLCIQIHPGSGITHHPCLNWLPCPSGEALVDFSCCWKY